MGAYDTNFDWSMARQESVRYSTALTNFLSAYSMTGKGRFVYISSHEVYNSVHGANVKEGTLTEPKGLKALAIAHGEELCNSYRLTQGMDTLILRFDHIYGIPKKGEHLDDPCFRMCLEALRTGKISANSRNSFSMIYMKDAIEFAYKVIMEGRPAQTCYHITSMEEIDEMQLAEIVRETMGETVEITDNSVGERHRLLLDGKRYQEEYQAQIFVGYDTGVQKVAQYMKSHRESFLKDEDSGGGQLGKLLHNARVVIRKLIPLQRIVFVLSPFLC